MVDCLPAVDTPIRLPVPMRPPTGMVTLAVMVDSRIVTADKRPATLCFYALDWDAPSQFNDLRAGCARRAERLRKKG